MTRILLTYVLPLLLPTAAYAAWIWYARKKHLGDGDPPAIRKGPLFWCLLAGFVLMAAGLVAVAIGTGHPPDAGVYRAPRIEDGKVVPPHFEKEDRGGR